MMKIQDDMVMNKLDTVYFGLHQQHLIISWPLFLILFLVSMKNSTKLPRFTKGDDIWVPTQEISRNTHEGYWPAQFIKVSNISHICIVRLYSPNQPEELQANEYIVEISKIKKFEEELPSSMSQNLQVAYKKAMQHQKQSKIGFRKITIREIHSAVELCSIFQDIYKNMVIQSNLKTNNPYLIPDFLIDAIPLQSSDLKIYFEGRLPQLILFILKTHDFSSDKAKMNLFEKWRKQMIEGILGSVQNNSLLLCNLVGWQT